MLCKLSWLFSTQKVEREGIASSLLAAPHRTHSLVRLFLWREEAEPGRVWLGLEEEETWRVWAGLR